MNSSEAATSFPSDEIAPSRISRKYSVGLVAAFAVWVMAVFGGTLALISYANSPGASGTALGVWPKASRLPLDAHRPTLIMFVHPQCPCSRASLGELEVLLDKFPGKINAHIVFLKPAGTVTNWEKAALWKQASAIPGVTLHTDDVGIEMSRFHAETSGQTLLYDQSGDLKFQGGITLGRGHSGDNPGRTELEELMRGEPTTLVKTPVFGCSLIDDQCTQGGTTWKR